MEAVNGPGEPGGWRLIASWFADAGGISQTLSGLAALVGIYLIWVQIKDVKRARRAEIFLDLADRWTAIYPQRLAVLKLPPLDQNKVGENYGHDYRKLFRDPIWQDMRALLNFFEVVGLLVHQKFITPAEVFVLVSVDHFGGHCNDPASCAPDAPDPLPEDGTVFAILKPYLAFLRETYRSDIYCFYDQYLLPEYIRRTPLRP